MTSELSPSNIHQDQEQPGSDSRPSILSREATTRLDMLHNKLDPPTATKGWTINRADAPTAADRSVLERRSHALAMGLAPSTKEQLLSRITTFYAGYPIIQAGDEYDAEDLVRVAVASLWGFPDWAVRDACLAALRGATDPRYVPNAAQLHELATDALAPFRREQDKIARVLNATPADVRPHQSVIDMAVDHWEQNVRPGMTGLTPEQQKEEDERKERQTAQNIRASQRLVEIQKKEAGITDDRPHSPALRRYLVKMGANFGGETGVGDYVPVSDREGGRTE